MLGTVKHWAHIRYRNQTYQQIYTKWAVQELGSRQSNNATTRKGQWGFIKNVMFEIILQGYAWIDQLDNLSFQHIQLENLFLVIYIKTQKSYFTINLNFKNILRVSDMSQQVNIQTHTHICKQINVFKTTETKICQFIGSCDICSKRKLHMS